MSACRLVEYHHRRLMSYDDVGIISIGRTFPDSALRRIISDYDYDEGR